MGPCDTVQFLFTTPATFVTGANSIIAYTTLPNGTTDSKTANDSIKLNICTSMSGAYTINPTGTGTRNYTSFTNAVSALACGGVSGPVVFSVAGATYTEQVSVPPINGTSATNTVLFDGGLGNIATRVITFPTTASQLAVVQFNNSNYITFRNLTIRSTGTTAGWVAHYLDGTNNRISNCRIDINGSGSTGSNLNPVVINGSPTTISTQSAISNNTLDSCVVEAGYYNVYIAMSTLTNTVNIFRNNLNNSYQYCVFGGGNHSPRILYNTINLRMAITSGYGIYFQNCNNTQGNFMDISGNKVLNAGLYAIYLTSCSKSGSDFNILSNNMLGGFRYPSGTYGMFLNSASRFLVYHNSIDLSVPAGSTGTNNAIFIQNGSGNEVVNNHLMISCPNALNAAPLSITPATAANVVNYNNYFNLSSDNMISIAGTFFTKFAYKIAWPSGGGVNSFNFNPQFKSSTDLHSTNTCNFGLNVSAIIPFQC